MSGASLAIDDCYELWDSGEDPRGCAACCCQPPWTSRPAASGGTRPHRTAAPLSYLSALPLCSTSPSHRRFAAPLHAACRLHLHPPRLQPVRPPAKAAGSAGHRRRQQWQQPRARGRRCSCQQRQRQRGRSWRDGRLLRAPEWHTHVGRKRQRSALVCGGCSAAASAVGAAHGAAAGSRHVAAPALNSSTAACRGGRPAAPLTPRHRSQSRLRAAAQRYCPQPGAHRPVPTHVAPPSSVSSPL